MEVLLKKVSQLFLVQREVLYNIKKDYKNLGPLGPLREPQSSPHFSNPEPETNQ